mmetsp:Transcript_22462/g.49047  ORF Transcript_22462/g.49047 Transcript_22462/m.49047 type:complete len:243 (-) Transcript_22462:148-876(-)
MSLASPGFAALSSGAVVAVTLWLLSRKACRARKPVLAVDMDEVIVGYLPAFIRFSNSMYGTCLSLHEFDSYFFWQVPGCNLPSRQASIERVHEFHGSPYFEKAVKPIEGAREALTSLQRYYELHIVTARQHSVADATHACLAEHFPGVFSGVHFGNHFGVSGKKVSKADLCRQIGAVAIIDDSLSHCCECAEAGIFAFVFGEYGWNRPRGDADQSWPNLVMRVPDWKAVHRALVAFQSWEGV